MFEHGQPLTFSDPRPGEIVEGTFLRAAFEQEDAEPRAVWAELDGQAVYVPLDRLAPTTT